MGCNQTPVAPKRQGLLLRDRKACQIFAPVMRFCSNSRDFLRFALGVLAGRAGSARNRITLVEIRNEKIASRVGGSGCVLECGVCDGERYPVWNSGYQLHVQES